MPRWLAGPFGGTGLGLGVGGADRRPDADVRLATCRRAAPATLSAAGRADGIAALHALVLLAPPLLSTDVFSYQAYARMGALFGANPYLTARTRSRSTRCIPFIGAKWVNTPSVYGPVFTVLSYVLAPLSIAVSALAYKAIAALSSLAIIALVWNAARLRGVDQVKAVALVGLNPLLVVYGVGGGHNDMLMLAAGGRRRVRCCSSTESGSAAAAGDRRDGDQAHRRAVPAVRARRRGGRLRGAAAAATC